MEIVEQKRVVIKNGETAHRLLISWKEGNREHRYWVASNSRNIEKVDMQISDNGILIKCALDTHLPEHVNKQLSAWFDAQKLNI